MEYIKFFKDLNKDSVKVAGGKGASLGEMYNEKLPIPDGFVVLSYAFDEFLNTNNLNNDITLILNKVNLKKIETVEIASEKIQSLILSKEISKELSISILSSFKKLETDFVAVRSSATSEDSISAAWAGQLDTFLNTTENKLLDNVKKCWASLFTERAIFYRFEKKLNNTDVSVAVVVQKMVNSDISGIGFSVHPVLEDYDKVIIEAGYGLGEAIVSGTITPDNYVYSKQKHQILDKTIATQIKALYRCSKNGTKWELLDKKQSSLQKLTDKQIIDLSEIIINIEKHYGFPVDVEWAIEKNIIYITQSRPITTLKNKN